MQGQPGRNQRVSAKYRRATLVKPTAISANERVLLSLKTRQRNSFTKTALALLASALLIRCGN